MAWSNGWMRLSATFWVDATCVAELGVSLVRAKGWSDTVAKATKVLREAWSFIYEERSLARLPKPKTT
jgi:hypothetical protein